MATPILMPKQGNSVESCLILDWKKQEGEPIKIGEILCEVETDKAAFEIESEQDGIVLKILYAVGENVPVLMPIAVIGQSGDDIRQFIATQGESPQSAAAAVTEQTPAQPSQTAQTIPTANVSADRTGRISSRARNLAAAKGLDVSGLRGTGPAGRIIERDVTAALNDHAPLTPAAVASLIERGLHGTGIGARIVAADLVATAPLKEEPTITIAAVPTEFQGAVKEIPVKGVRKIIASRMLQSLQTTAQVTLHASADASKLLAYRKRCKAAPETFGVADITINDLVLFAVAKTLTRCSFLNAHFLGDTLREFARVHLGIAVDTSRGLMVPVIRNADQLSLKSLSQEAKRLAAACQDGKILPDELSGGTFTVTNLGALGVESFTPVLNPPEVGILGVCAIQPKPVMCGEDVAFVPHLGLSLTFDHQAVDGAPAARFLKELSTAIANIDLLLG